jgi:hypothetical protein
MLRHDAARRRDAHVYEAKGNDDLTCRTCGLTPTEAAITDLRELVAEADQVRLEIWSFQGYSTAHHYVDEAMQNLRAAIHELTPEKETTR